MPRWVGSEGMRSEASSSRSHWLQRRPRRTIDGPSRQAMVKADMVMVTALVDTVSRVAATAAGTGARL